MKLFVLLSILLVPVFSDTLHTAIYGFPPCVILKKNEPPTGFDIDVFERIARGANLKIVYEKPKSFLYLLKGMENGIYDGAVAGITITGERESKFDFSHPYLNSGLMICVKKGPKISPFNTMFRYINNMGPMLLLILLFTSICGILVWFIEKNFAKENSMFNPNEPSKGIFNGFYFSNIFSSTVGFGDLVPKSIPGKILTIILIIIGVYFIFPYAVANMNMALQQEQDATDISSVEDLAGKRVSTEKGTTSNHFLDTLSKKINCRLILTNSIDSSYSLLKQGRVDAVVFDMPSIKYFVKNKGRKHFVAVGNIFDRQSYGFALKQNSPYREILNERLVDFMRTPEYWELYEKWFGKIDE